MGTTCKLSGGAVEVLAVTETLMPGIVERTLGGIEGVITDIMVVVGYNFG